MAPQRIPDPGWKPLKRLKSDKSNGTLKAGTAFVNTNVRYEIVNVAGMSKITVRAKATAAGTLDIFFIGPDVDIDAVIQNDTAYASIAGTIYTTGNATQGTLVANTEQVVTVACSGEDYVIIKFTGTATGAITYVDVAMLSTGLS